MFKRICLVLLHFYQRFLSPLKPQTCRYYPSCSEYALWQFQKNRLIFAFYFTLLRILRCNPLFKGGFDYPKVFKVMQSQNFCFKPKFLAQKPLCFLYIPYKNKGFILLKSFNQKEK